MFMHFVIKNVTICPIAVNFSYIENANKFDMCAKCDRNWQNGMVAMPNLTPQVANTRSTTWRRGVKE